MKLVGTSQMLVIDHVKGIDEVLNLLTRMKKNPIEVESISVE